MQYTKLIGWYVYFIYIFFRGKPQFYIFFCFWFAITNFSITFAPLQIINNNMKPFNLKEALEGKPIVTRDGRKVIDFHYFENSTDEHPLIVLIEGKSVVVSHTKDGKYSKYCNQSDTDLFMSEEPKTYYINVYKDSYGYPYLGEGLYSTKESAERLIANNNTSYTKTIKITLP